MTAQQAQINEKLTKKYERVKLRKLTVDFSNVFRKENRRSNRPLNKSDGSDRRSLMMAFRLLMFPILKPVQPTPSLPKMTSNAF